MDRTKRVRKPKRLNDFWYPEPKRSRKTKSREKENGPHPEKSPQHDSVKTPEIQPIPEQVQSPPIAPVRSNQKPTTSSATTSATAIQTRKPTTLEKLNELYTDPAFPSAYSANLSTFLRQKESLSRHKRRVLKFKRRKVKVNGPFTLVQADTIFYRNYARQNGGYKYILVVIDCFSRKNWCRPLRTTTADESAKNLDDILQSMPYKPSQFASDQGNEFNSKHPSIFKTLVDKYGMLMFTLKGPHKASIVERFIRTLKSRIERYFTEKNTVRWIDILPKISKALNNSYHRSIGMTPNQVNFENRSIVYNNLYGARGPPTICKFQVGDHVRIPLEKDIFDKGYSVAWSKEIFKIADKRSDGEVCYYFILTLEGNPVSGKRFYYEEELNLVLRNEVS